MYRLWKKDLVFAWKTEDERSLSALFASVLYKAAVSAHLESFAFVPVPPRPGKIKEKGWDQIEEVSSILERRYKIRILRVLKRISLNEQKRLTRSERLGGSGAQYVLKEEKNIKKVLKKYKLPDFPESAVILDDVVTTGSTLKKCADLIRTLGAKKVYALSLFRVD